MLFRFFWPSVTWSAIILVLSLIPGKELPDVKIFQVDKLVHFFFFSVLTFLTSYGIYKLCSIGKIRLWPIATGLGYSLSLGILIEILQRYVPGRSFSYADMFANAIGAGIGCVIFIYFKKRNSPQQ